jgi:hypothetical protein
MKQTILDISHQNQATAEVALCRKGFASWLAGVASTCTAGT